MRRVCVKLVSRSGIGTIAAGVAKAKADAILVSGHSAAPAPRRRSSHQVCRPALGDGAVRDAPGAAAQPAAPPREAAHRWRPQDRPRRGDRRHARRRGIRHRHRIAGGDGLHHGAPVPFQHLPGRRLRAGRGAAREVHRHAGEGHQPVLLRRGGGARDPGLARLPHADRRDRPHRPAAAGQPRRRRISTTSTSTRCWCRPMPARMRAYCTLEGRNEVPETLDARDDPRRRCAVPRTARRCSCSTTSGTRIAPSAPRCRRASRASSACPGCSRAI